MDHHDHDEILLGQGQLTWPPIERQTDRYGAVALQAGHDTYVQFPPAADGHAGRLVARVLATRQSGHLGDWARGIYPQTPTVGEEITLGSGQLFIQGDPAFQTVGVHPDDDRDTDWLDPHALYRVHDQTVQLVLKPARPEADQR